MLMVPRVVPEALSATVQSQPLWLQAIEALIIADIGFYLAHRAFHAVPFLWRFHAIHHSIEEMDWLAAHRVHPVDQILTKSASFLPLFALGFQARRFSSTC
ncbi:MULTISPECIES: sterol desaturase family protein [unclassified Mesorhizobium]|uniref:sterol desaturase family protein n=1 Tax=unclassified Mesorhizobium TaxID=325217 RepID=UPI001FEFA72C|nr:MULTISPECIES: sterol desaturase family protein [unclassified Mesorhizobium]